jgi:hypothetical protein
MRQSLSFSVRFFLLAFGAFCFIWGALFYFSPTALDSYLPWTATNALTLMFVGSVYLALVGNVWTVHLIRWSVARVQLPPLLVLAATQLLAFWLERSSLPQSNLFAWVWIASQSFILLCVLILFPLNERAASVSKTNVPDTAAAQFTIPVSHLTPGFARGMLLLTVILFMIGAALFFFPAPIATITAWSLSPLDARILGSLHFAGAALTWMMSRQKNLLNVQVGLLILSMAATLLLIGSAWHVTAFNGPTLTVLVYVLILLLILSISALSWLRERQSRDS